VTTFGNTYRKYLSGLSDDTVEVSGFFDGTADAIDDVMTALLANSNGEVLTAGWNGDTVGNRGVSITVVASNYEVTDSVDDAAEVKVEFTCKNGLVRGQFLRAKSLQTYDNSAGGSPTTNVATGTSVDNAAASTGGYDASLHIFSVAGAGTTLDVIVEHSSDNSSWSTLGTFTQRAYADGKGALRISGAGTVNRYVRVKGTLTIPANVNTTPGWSWACHLSRSLEKIKANQRWVT
jgi:hypothetical protein